MSHKSRHNIIYWKVIKHNDNNSKRKDIFMMKHHTKHTLCVKTGRRRGIWRKNAKYLTINTTKKQATGKTISVN